MTISFSGLASGLDTTSWIESLVALKRAKVTVLQEERESVSTAKDALSSIKSFFNTFRTTIQKITNSRLNPVAMNIFAQNIATSADLNILTATATHEADEGTYKVKVDKLATKTNATSNFRQTTTIVETTTATSDTKLIDLGVKTGYITVNNDGALSHINIQQDDTIATFIDKLKNAGVEASYNGKTGVFTINIDSSAINDIDGTKIKEALHLADVSEGYETLDKLEIKKIESVWDPVNVTTKLSELGINEGTITVRANDKDYTIDIDDGVIGTQDYTFGNLLADLGTCNIEATLDSNGVFTIKDAVIVDDGDTDLINLLGLEDSVYSKSQNSDSLKLETVVTQTTTATSATLLKDIGEGTAIVNGDEVIVTNSNNEITTITVGETTTIGQLLAGISNAGLYAAINNDGTIEISGGKVEKNTGSTFDPITALGLTSEPYTAMVSGNPLTEVVTNYEIVDLQTRLVEDLGVTRGYLEVTDADGNKFYEKIYSGQTIADFMADLGNLGIYTSLDENSGVLSITGGAFRTLDNVHDETGSLIANGTIVETDDAYKRGTNLLECLYGSDVIATDHIEVASAYSRTKALTRSVTYYVNADLSTSLETIGLTTEGTAIFESRGNTITLDITKGMTIQELMNKLAEKGISTQWDEYNSKLTLENAVLTGGTSNLDDVLNLTETVSGKYATTSALFSTTTATINATEDTLLSELGINSEQTVVLNTENGETTTFNVNGTTTLGNLIDQINTLGVTATLDNGVLKIENGFITNATLEEALGLEKTITGESNVLGTKITRTITTTATGDTTLGEIITALGSESAVSGGYDLAFNSQALSVSADTTIDDLVMQIHEKGGTASIDSTGRLRIDGGTLSGTVANALGFNSVSATMSVSSTGKTFSTITTINADSTTKLGDIGLGVSTIDIKGTDDVAVGTITTNADMTIGDILTALSGYGISGTIENGIINLSSNNGNYATGGVLTSMGVGTTEDTFTTTAGTTNTSSDVISNTYTVTANMSTTLGELGISEANRTLVVNHTDGTTTTLSFEATSSLNDVLTSLAGYGIQGRVEAGMVILDNGGGDYVTGALAEALGIGAVANEITITPGKTYTSSIAITYTTTQVAEDTTTLKEIGISTDNTIHFTQAEAEALGYTWVTTAAELTTALTGSDANTKVMLGSNIDLDSWTPITDFRGTFDGNGYTVSGTVSDNTTGNKGFFANIDGGTVRNLTLYMTVSNSNNSSTLDDYFYGVLAGVASNATIDNVVVTNSLLEQSNTSTHLASRGCGGLIGRAEGSTAISNCIVKDSEISAANINNSAIGGLVGDQDSNVNITNCYVTNTSLNASDHGNTSHKSFFYIGGLVGYSSGTILNSGVDSTITISSVGSDSIYRAELVGYGYGSTIINSNYVANNGLTTVGPNINSADIINVSSITSITTTVEDLTIYDQSGNKIFSTELAETTTLGDVVNILSDNGIQASVSGGRINIEATNGNYIVGSVASALGIETNATVSKTTIGITATSTATVSYTQEISATITDKVSDYTRLRAEDCDGVVTATSITGTTIGISTAQDLANLAAAVNSGVNTTGKTFVLLNDIDLSEYSDFVGIGTSAKAFKGTFDGQEFTISNLQQIQDYDETEIGLFNNTSSATVKNVKLENITITDNNPESSHRFIGALIGYATSTDIENINIKNLSINMNATVDRSCIGGAVGSSTDGSAKNIQVEGSIADANNDAYNDYIYTGGIFGQVTTSKALTYMYSDVNLSNTSGYRIGGIAGGYYYSGSDMVIAEYCANVGVVGGNTGFSGGLFGSIDSVSYITIKDSYSTDYYYNSLYRDLVYDTNGHVLTIINCGYLNNAPCDTATTIENCYTNINAINNYFKGINWVDTPETAGGGIPSPNTGRIPTPADLIIKNSSGSTLGGIVGVQDMTFEELFTKLNAYGINCTLSDGVITVNSSSGNYVTGDIWEKLGFEVFSTTTSVTTTTPIQVTSSTAVTYTTTTTADATTTLGSIKYVIDGSITASGVTGTVIGISTATDLQNLATLVNNGNNMSGKTFVLTNDIDLSGVANWTSIGTNTRSFNGTFDGQGHTISNLTQSTTLTVSHSEARMGFFANLSGATIKNLKFKDATLSGSVTDSSTAVINMGLVGFCYKSTISGVEVINANYTGNGNCNIGGIIGYSTGQTTITNSSTSGEISGTGGCFAGIMGYCGLDAITIDTVQNDINVNAKENCWLQFGGIIGSVYTSGAGSYLNISNVLNKGNVTVENTAGSYSGGIIGSFRNSNNSYAYTINIERTINLGSIGTENTADAICIANSSVTPHANSKININYFYGKSSSNTDSYVVNYDPNNVTATLASNISTEGSARNIAISTMRTRIINTDNGWDLSKWAPSTALSNFNLKTGDEYDIFVYNGSGAVEKTIDLNADNTIQDIVSALQGYGECSFVDGKISYNNSNSTWNVSGTGASLLNTSLKAKSPSTLTSDTTLNDLGLTGSSYQITIKNSTTNAYSYITLSSDKTVGDFMTELAAYGFDCSITGGKLTVKSVDNSHYVYGANTTLESKLKIDFASNKSYTVKTSTTTTYAGSTRSDIQTKEEVTNLVNSTKFSNIGIDSSTITVVSNGTSNVITLSAEQTLGDMFSILSGYGIVGSVNSGKVTFYGSNNSYIKGMENNLRTALKLNNNFNSVKTECTISNTNSDTFEAMNVTTLNSSTTFAEIGLNNSTQTVELTTPDGIRTLTIQSNETIGDLMSSLAAFDINSRIADGKLYIYGNENNYVSSIGENLNNVLHLSSSNTGGGTNTFYTQTTTIEQTYTTTDTMATSSTIGSLHKDAVWADPQSITVNSNGTEYTLTVTDEQTIDDVLTSLAGLGIYGFVSDGKLTLQGDDEAYIKGITTELNTALKLGANNYTTTEHTRTSNTASTQQKQTVTAVATGATTLEDLRDQTGAAASNYSLILSTTSDAGNNLVTLTFSATSTVYDVIDELANYGLNASIDGTGRFALNSSTLTDFDISGGLGEFIMGSSYEKVYNEGSVSSISTNLIQNTEITMNDETLLSDLGITNGNIVLYKDSALHTIAIDNTKTVADFRAQLGEYGVNSSIVDGKLQLIANGVVYLKNPDAGASNLVDKMGLGHANWGFGDYVQKSEHLTDTETIVNIATMDTIIGKLTDENGNLLDITNGQIYVYHNGARSIIDINTNETLQNLANKLEAYGISVGISSNGKVYFDGENDSYLTTNGLSSGASNILTKIGLSAWDTRYDSTSETLDYEIEEDSKDVGSTKLTDLQDADGNNLGITEGTYYVYQNGVRSTETITADTTVNDFRATMASYGLITDFNEDGSLSVGAYNNTYLATSATSGDDTNAIDVLFEQWNFVNVYNSNGLEMPSPETVAITTTTKFADIENATYQAGYITVVKDGVATNIELTADATVGDLIDELAMFGFESIINTNGELIIKNTGNSLLQAYNGAGQASNALTILGIGIDDWVITNTYESGTVSVVTTSTEDVSATRDTLLSELGVSTGEYYIYNNGVKYTAMISTDETIGSLMDTLNRFGIQTSLVDDGSGAVLSIFGSGDSYVAKSTSVNNASNVVDKLFTTSEVSKSYTCQKDINIIKTTFVTATEDTLLNTYGDCNGDLSVFADDENHTIRILETDTIGTFIDKLRATGLDAAYLDGEILITNGTINAVGTTSGVMANLNIVYNNAVDDYSASNSSLIETTVTVDENRVFSVANYANENTAMDLLNITSGTLTIYRDGEKATLQIDSSKNFSDIQDQLDSRFGDVYIKFEEGYLTFYSDTKHVNVEVGSTTDTSNFSAITGVQRTEDGEVKSARELYCVNASSVITTSGIFRNSDVKEGTFKIGDAEFTIEDDTTISDIVSQINASQEANATAYWDSIDAKLVIQSRTTGSALINIEAGTSNFTDVMGFTNSEWTGVDGDGDGFEDLAITKMNVEAQEIGENAKFAINGTYYTSTKNEIGSDVSRIKGLTINLKGISEGETTITVERDKETVANTVSDIVDAYNELITNVDKEIAKGGTLEDQFTLKLLRNQIRNMMTGSILTTGVYKNLYTIGISVEKASANNIATENVDKLYFDKDKFIKAFDADRDSLKTLLIGTSESDKGLFGNIEYTLDQAINFTGGYFQTAEKSYNNQISRLTEKIKKAETSVERYRERLEAKFASMDLLISKMQNQYSSFLSA